MTTFTGIELEPPIVDCTDRLLGKCMTQSSAKSSWWRPSYFVDWAIVAVVAIGDIIEIALWDPNVNPYQAAVQSTNGTFSFNDNQFQFPFETETFKPWVNALISIGIPVALAICYHLFLRFGPSKDRSLHDIHHFLLGMATTVALAYFAWIPTNRLCGQFRPDFWYRLQTGDSGTITDGRESFPSGHALCAFLGLGFFMLWMCGKLFVFHSGGGHMWRFFLAVMCPMALAIAQAVSRVTNHLHHPVDILGGAILGMGAAICAYHLNYPPAWAPDCHRPKNRKFSYFTYAMSGVPPAPQADPHFPV
jgi:diacylglycerol diphosphate phosphatase/phosphatidate phosphatase